MIVQLFVRKYGANNFSFIFFEKQLKYINNIF